MPQFVTGLMTATSGNPGISSSFRKAHEKLSVILAGDIDDEPSTPTASEASCYRPARRKRDNTTRTSISDNQRQHKLHGYAWQMETRHTVMYTAGA